MSFLATGFLWVAGLALAGVVVAHLFSRSRPREMVLPTARFVPEGAARAPTRARVPTDLSLLALRAATVLLIGAAFAQPVIQGARRDVARVLAVDVSSHLAGDSSSRAAVLDSLRTLHRDGDEIVVFDTAVRRVASLDSVFAGPTIAAPGSLSAGLIGAMRAASEIARSADSVEIAIISPMHTGELDSATAAIRAAWPGRIRVVRSPGRSAAEASSLAELAAPIDDPLRASVALAGPVTGAEVRVVRVAPSGADSAWAAAGNRVLVVWPDSIGAHGGSVGAVLAGGRVVVAPFEAAAVMPERSGASRRDASRATSQAASVPMNGRVLARWMDGVPAATELAHGSGCIRSVAIPLPTAGDLAVRSEFVLLVRELLAPCGGRRALDALPEPVIATLSGAGPLAKASEVARGRDDDSRLAGWLLVAALVLALIEQLVRRRTHGMAPTPAPASPGLSTARSAARADA